MKLLIAADIFPPDSGGPATYAVSLANELIREGVEVKIVSLNPQSDQSAVSCDVYRVSWKNKLPRYFQYLCLLYKYAKNTDIVYAMGPVNAGLPAWLAARLRGKKFVVKVVGDYAWEQGIQRYGITDGIDEFQKHFSKYILRAQLLKSIQSFIVRRSDAVIVPSQYLKRMVIAWGTGEQKIQVIYNAVSFLPVAPRTKPAGEKWIVTAARLVPWKGIDTLVKIMPEIIREIPVARLKIIGDGPEYENFKFQISNFKLEGVVELLGQLPRQQTLAYLSAADLFVLNSGYEGLSHVLLEAIRAGTPALASNIGGNPEVIMPGQNGDLFEYNNKIEIKNKIIQFLGSGRDVGSVDFSRFQLATMIRQTKESLECLCAN